MIPARITAITSTAVLAATGAVVLAAPSASAGTVTPSLHCVLPASQGEGTGPQSITIELDRTTVEPGGLVKGKVTLGESFMKSTVTMPNIPTAPTIQLAMKGAATGGVVISGPEIPISVEKDKPVPIPPYEGAFNIPASATSGKVEFTVVKTVTYTTVTGVGKLSTTCDVVSGGDATVAEISVEGTSSEQPTLTAPEGTVYTGSEIALSGMRFTPGGTPQLTLCNEDGSGCDPGKFTSHSLTIDAQGNLSGKARLFAPLAPVPLGTYQVVVSDGTKEGRDTIQLQTKVAGQRQITLSTSSGPVGTRVRVQGSEFPGHKGMTISAHTETNAVINGVQVISNPDGTFDVTLTITGANTVNIRAREGISQATAVIKPFEVTPGAVNYQDVSVGLNAGALTMSQTGTGIDFGTATLNGQAQTLNANLNQVTVLDARGGTAGWSLVGTLTDLTASDNSASIPAGNVTWTPACAKSETSPSAVVTGSAGPLGSTASALCSQAADTEGVTGGRFTADAALTLTTPDFPAAGTYTGTLTLTLS